MPDRHDLAARALGVFELVFELPPAERAARLDELCRDDAPLRAEVESLLTHHDRNSEALLRTGEGPLDALGVADTDAPELAAAIGPYRIDALLGRGGMGAVYRAEQHDPIRRTVALKVVQRGAATDSVLRRFALERRALAAMNHSCIAKVIDAGATDDGQPYFVMELVEGLPLTDYCDEHELSIPERIRLFQEVCRGVQHAHQKGVIHRDLKPANVLVKQEDRTAVPKILDFGIAKVTSDEFAGVPLQTAEQSVVGTPEYMSPEQASRDGTFLDLRTDVYSLGVMLYELLCGELPFASERLRSKGPLGALEVIRDEEPQRPSTRLTTAAGAHAAAAATRRRATAPALAKALRADLDWITMKALAKDRERRYESADALANDLQRYLDHEPVLAGPPSAGYRVRKFARRYRGQLAAAVALFVALAGGLLATLFFWRQADTLAAEKDEQFQLARQNLEHFHQAANLVLLEDAKAAVVETFPASSKNRDTIERWLTEHADPILAKRDALRSALAAVEERALPRTAEQVEADRRGHPDYDELVRAQHDRREREAAMAVRKGEAELPDIRLDDATLALNQEELFGYVRRRLDPRLQTVSGEQVQALLASRLHAERAEQHGPSAHAESLRTLTWSAFRCGLDGEARAAAKRAVEVAPAAAKATFEAYAQELEKSMAGAEGVLAEARAKCAELEQKVSTRRTWEFAKAEDEFLHDVLSQLVAELGTFDEDVVTRARLRLKWASTVGRITTTHPNAPASWDEARAAIRAADGVTASERYRSDPPLELEPQEGLIPIGMNPVTKLWEFYHLRSAFYPDRDRPAEDYPIPTIDDDGRIAVDNLSGIVFVLIPGGSFWMGAQNADPNGPNFDRAADADEAPDRVTLAPFFLARHELTMAQYERLVGADHPSGVRPGQRWRGNADKITWMHPAEQFSWEVANALMTRNDLELPTEAQWEYACRAGSTTAFYTGPDPVSLDGHANIADETAHALHPSWQYVPGVRDGWLTTAPVGTYAFNAFGLHDMQGNVTEFVRDWFIVRYQHSPARPGDGLRDRPDGQGDFLRRCQRGGNHQKGAFQARSANRQNVEPHIATNLTGLRASRPLRAGGS